MIPLSPKHILLYIALLLIVVSFFTPLPLQVPLLLVTVACLLP